MLTVPDVLPSSYCRGALRRTGRFHFGGPTGSDAIVARFLAPQVITRELLVRGIEIFVDALRESERVQRARSGASAS
jgi:hypothetical protein